MRSDRPFRLGWQLLAPSSSSSTYTSLVAFFALSFEQVGVKTLAIRSAY